MIGLPKLLFKRKSCEREEKTLSKKEILKKAELCLEKEKFSSAVLILENFLKKNTGQKKTKILKQKLAEISFYHLKDYNKALKYYTELLKISLLPTEKFSAQYHIAKAFYYLGKYSQALIEVERCFFKGVLIDEEKKALLLKGRIFMAQEDFDKALALFQAQIKKNPDQRDFFREYIAFIYESQENFLKAAQELKKIEKPSIFIQGQIERLKKRQNSQPGF